MLRTLRSASPRRPRPRHTWARLLWHASKRSRTSVWSSSCNNVPNKPVRQMRKNTANHTPTVSVLSPSSGSNRSSTRSTARCHERAQPVLLPALNCSVPLPLTFCASAMRSGTLMSSTLFSLASKSMSSTSNFSVALAGMVGGLPEAPYAYSGPQVRMAFCKAEGDKRVSACASLRVSGRTQNAPLRRASWRSQGPIL